MYQRKQKPMAEQYLYDDFFADDSTPGVVTGVQIRGRNVPITLKRGVSFKDFSEAKEQATTMGFKPDGRPYVIKYSDGIFGIELCVRCIQSWPFDRDGKPVPVTRESIAALGTDGVSAIVSVLMEVMSKGVEALVPFVSPSAEVS
jgi:hypothetical protein